MQTQDEGDLDRIDTNIYTAIGLGDSSAADIIHPLENHLIGLFIRPALTVLDDMDEFKALLLMYKIEDRKSYEFPGMEYGELCKSLDKLFSADQIMPIKSGRIINLDGNILWRGYRPEHKHIVYAKLDRFYRDFKK